MVPIAGSKEAELIKACMQNDQLAQRKLYDQYKRAMFTLCNRITGDYDLAQDVLQEGFVKVFRGLGSFRGESTLGAWIKTIIVRTAYGKLRSQKMHFESLENVASDEVVDWGDYLQAEYLEKAINSLPDGYRTVFTLVEIEGYAHKEVAEMMEISVGTSKSQLFYAKRKLREILKEYGY
ncbi:MAG: RNA polymerase sigma factor [Saprospiraceae bacterium]|nr:RNA polymerase sigma factor [Saprospiraceae bacterium]